jgi:hypothetical protein
LICKDIQLALLQASQLAHPLQQTISQGLHCTNVFLASLTSKGLGLFPAPGQLFTQGTLIALKHPLKGFKTWFKALATQPGDLYEQNNGDDQEHNNQGR